MKKLFSPPWLLCEGQIFTKQDFLKSVFVDGIKESFM